MKIKCSSLFVYLFLIFIQLHAAESNFQPNKHSTDWNKLFRPFGFGSNKPHLIFHVGNRDAITHNMAYGYWLEQPNQASQQFPLKNYFRFFSDIRFKYQNTREQLYVDVVNHDGQKVIWQKVKDNRYKVQTQIKYFFDQEQKKSAQYSYQISWKNFQNDHQPGAYDIFRNSKVNKKNDQHNKQFSQGNLVWFIALSVENNQLRFINHKDYFSPICFSLEREDETKIKVHMQKLEKDSETKELNFNKKQTFTFTGQNLKSMKMFGFTVNISEGYQSSNYLNELKDLIELQKYGSQKIHRKNDSKIVQWENNQIQSIKKENFNAKYTYVIIYGFVSREKLLKHDEQPRIYVTNSTTQTQFNQKTFNRLTLQNQNRLFPYQKIQTKQEKELVQKTVYNLISGLVYYEGKLYTQNSIMSHQHDYSFSFTPSRLIFPRSFLWDDGFHNSIMASYKPEVTMQVLHSWFKKVDLFGWIGREQIRGFEIISMMPDSRFIFQDVFELNPPTIVIPVLKLLQIQSNLSPQQIHKLHVLLENHFPSLEKHFRYFVKTQSHFDLAYKEDLLATIKYRWRCKDECAKGNFMGSGLDDYPRVQNEAQISKEHIDLSSWLWFFSDALQKIALFLQKDKAAKFYSKWKHRLRQKIIEECLDETDMLFKDLAVMGQKLFIDQKVTKIGYINLFPFFVGLLQTFDNDSPQMTQKIMNALRKTIEVMTDQNKLMSAGGIRSLSISDTDYASEQNYWRGASWMPINYMILRACKKYFWNIKSEPHKQQIHRLYAELRKRLIETVNKNYQKYGYLFQNYIEGEGNRGYPFNGWTSLIASIITEDY